VSEPTGESRPKTIVIADDQDLVRGPVAFLLARKGYRVVEARTGDEALEAVRRERPDLLLLDAIMPRRTGIDVLRALRADAATAATPVVMLSAHPTKAYVDAARELGALDFIVKGTFHIAELAKRIERALARGAGDAATPPPDVPGP